jgi:hypothetical protein
MCSEGGVGLEHQKLSEEQNYFKITCQIRTKICQYVLFIQHILANLATLR